MPELPSPYPAFSGELETSSYAAARPWPPAGAGEPVGPSVPGEALTDSAVGIIETDPLADATVDPATTSTPPLARPGEPQSLTIVRGATAAAPLGSAEIGAAWRGDPAQAPLHLATITVLHCAGVENTIHDFWATIGLRRRLAAIEAGPGGERKKAAASQPLNEELAGHEAASDQYAAALAEVTELAGGFDREYTVDGRPDRTKIGELYDRTDIHAHAGAAVLDDLRRPSHNERTQSAAIQASHVFRYMLDLAMRAPDPAA